MNGDFARRLAALRRAAGYASAREFYKAVDGRRTLGCTYAQYLNVEAGRSVPKAALARKALALLSLQPDDPRCRGAVTAYLEAALKDGAFLELVRQVYSAPPGAGDAPLRRALDESARARRVQLSQSQVDAVEGDETAYWCFQVFCNDPGGWDARALSRLLGYGVPALRRALARLSAAGVIREHEKGVYRIFAPGKSFTCPREDFHVPKTLARWLRRLKTPPGPGPRVEMYRSLVLRASAARLKQYSPFLAESVAGAGLYAESRGGEDTGLYVVEGVVRRLLDF
ncbi:hypothetical protein EPO15_08250 [bacterium]|nr:MAG: hypothetical protein EPO15_08250 [bacterium]